jgi:hypothetical protein
VTAAREVIPGTTPASPRMRTMRITGESLNYAQTFLDSDELRADRMLADPTKIMQEAGGGINFELSYPEDNSPLSEIIRSALWSAWINTPTFDNDGTADSVITDAGTTSNTYVVASGGAAVKAGHLVQATGFAQSANNQIFRATSSTSTTIVGTGLSLVAETAPAAAAKLKVVGFQGASGDITATSTGLGSTALDFTTLGLTVGQWVKIGGTAAGDKFATAALNDYARVAAISANALTLDNRPAGWGTDTGSGKTVKVWFGDTIRNGITQSALTIEKGFMGQSVPTYIALRGMTVDQFTLSMQSRQKITGTVSFKGMGGGQDTVSLDSTPDAATTNPIMASHVNIGRISEGGAQVAAPNYMRAFELTVANKVRTVEDIGTTSPVGILAGGCTVSAKVDTYFGDNAVLTKFYNQTATSVSARVTKNGQTVVVQVPRATYKDGGNPQASGKDQDVILSLTGAGSVDALTSSSVIIDRLPYVE